MLNHPSIGRQWRRATCFQVRPVESIVVYRPPFDRSYLELFIRLWFRLSSIFIGVARVVLAQLSLSDSFELGQTMAAMESDSAMLTGVFKVRELRRQ